MSDRINGISSGNVASDAFPVPRDDTSTIPVWALAVIIASAGVTVVWLIAIVLLVRAMFPIYDLALKFFNNFVH